MTDNGQAAIEADKSESDTGGEGTMFGITRKKTPEERHAEFVAYEAKRKADHDEKLGRLRAQVDSTSQAERNAALPELRQVLEQDRATELTALDKQRADIAARFDREIEQLAANEEEKLARLAAVISADFHAALKPLLRAWIEQPSRKLAVTIGDVYAEYAARTELELGDQLMSNAVSMAMVNAMVAAEPRLEDAAVAAFGGGYGGDQVTRVGAASTWFVRALRQSAIDTESALTELEAATCACLRAHAGKEVNEWMRERFGIARGAVARREMLKRFNQHAEHERRRAGFVDVPARPLPPSSHTMSTLPPSSPIRVSDVP